MASIEVRMPEQKQDPKIGKVSRSVIESDHPVFGRVKKELPLMGARAGHGHPWLELWEEWNARFQVNLWFFIALTAFVISFFIYRQITDPFLDYKLGDVAQRHLVAQKTVEMVDEETTETKRRTAVEQILSVYDYDRRIFFQTTEKIRRGFALVRKDPLEAKKQFSAVLEVDITDQQFDALMRLKFSRKAERILIHLLSKVNLNLIVSNKELLASEQGRGITLHRIGEGAPDKQDSTITAISSIMDVEAARKQIETDAKEFLTGTVAAHAEGLLGLAKRLVVPNLTLNRQETEKRKTAAVAEIKPVIVKVAKGESIIKYGETVSRRHLALLKEMEKSWENDSSRLQFLFTAIFLFILIAAVASFLEGGLKPFHYGAKDLAVFLGLMVGSILAIKGIQFIAAEALVEKFPQVPFDFYYYMLPVAVGPMVIRMIAVKEPALVFSLVLGTVGGILLDRNFFYAVYVLASSLVAANLARRVNSRGVIYRAGLITGLVNVLMITCIVANTRNAASVSMLWNDMGWIVWAGMLSGVLSSMITVAVVPIVELFSGRTSDLRLLELANMNHPLLRDLMVKAPGTYHHSIVIGSLVEAASESIGANPLLARVMAYYHDVGKMERPLYFIENQAGGTNRHDSLQPHMSAMIIREHVKRGQELGRKHKLPQPIIDVMSEHHGTSTIWYFFNKAKSQAEDPDSVLESDYKYDGSKPQSKEAALVMLGDVVEAATRSIADPSPLRLSGVVKNILNKYFAEGELSECELTLRDLDLIAKSFLDVLLGIYHARIEYGVPGLRDGKRKNAGSDQKGSGRVPPGGGPGGAGGVTPISKAWGSQGSGSGGSR
ncbi:MAG: HDIG domain-containing protein [Bdellovibrionales bacterium]|nr:HDIG domain-containing protein [Bdellovibrionales bacterium]